MLDQPVLRLGEQRRGAMRLEPDANNGDMAGRPQVERAQQLAGNDHRRLPLPSAVRVYTIERITEVQNQLGPAIGKHRLCVGDTARVAVERPHTVHDRRERGCRREFPVLHGGRPTVTFVSDSFKRQAVTRATVASRSDFMRSCVATIITLAIILVPLEDARAQRGKPTANGTAAQLAWLAGTWSGGDGPVRFEERWTPAAGGAMLGVSRTLKGDRMVAFEFLRIVEREGSLVYIAQPGGRPPTEFALTAISADSATFENSTHDFPKMIRYSRRADGSLEARVSDGGPKGETFLFKKAP